MSTIMPDSERMKKAVRLVTEQRREKPEKKSSELADEAIFQFDLNPHEAEFLVKFVAGKAGQ